jgi:hypothetical protein
VFEVKMATFRFTLLAAWSADGEEYESLADDGGGGGDDNGDGDEEGFGGGLDATAGMELPAGL